MGYFAISPAFSFFKPAGKKTSPAEAGRNDEPAREGSLFNGSSNPHTRRMRSYAGRVGQELRKFTKDGA
jgi:hypothetical protein